MILDDLVAATRRRIDREKEELSPGELHERVLAAHEAGDGAETPGPSFIEALRHGHRPGLSFICEVKKASPSKGIIAPDFPYVSIAREYEAAGADAISVLTEPDYFKGELSYIGDIRGAGVTTPILRKDFTIDPYMIDQAYMAGASAILLICAILTDEELGAYLAHARSLGLDALVETHDEEEVKRALSSGARIIGVNNRDLKDFTVDIGRCTALRDLVPAEHVFVAESGIRDVRDTSRLLDAGVDAVLIGETLMRAEDKGAALNALRP